MLSKAGIVMVMLCGVAMAATSAIPESIDPCRPSPCGVNAVCQDRNRAAACSCLPGLQGDPYVMCRPECTINHECADQLACVRNKCVDPCPGVCGVHATCSVNNHYPICRCDPGYQGDPFSYCLQPPRPTEIIDPCTPSPCGSNAVCSDRNRAAACQCIPEYFGDPYVACRPECLVNSDCPSNKACQRNKCVDPCPGVCGINANCRVMNHNPTCICVEGYVGDPFVDCRQIPLRLVKRDTASDIENSLNDVFGSANDDVDDIMNDLQGGRCVLDSQCIQPLQYCNKESVLDMHCEFVVWVWVAVGVLAGVILLSIFGSCLCCSCCCLHSLCRKK